MYRYAWMETRNPETAKSCSGCVLITKEQQHQYIYIYIYILLYQNVPATTFCGFKMTCFHYMYIYTYIYIYMDGES